MYLFSSFSKLLKKYPYQYKVNKKIILVIVLNKYEKLSVWTIKSLLNQTCQVDDIYVETMFPFLINREFRKVVTVHYIDTIKINEIDSETLIIPITNGKIYNKNFILEKINADFEMQWKKNIKNIQ
jgi:hypothetical protein